MDQKPTFVGPVTTERAVLGGKRVLSCYFLLLPTGSDPIKLEYLDKVQAVEARVQLLLLSGHAPGGVHQAPSGDPRSGPGDETRRRGRKVATGRKPVSPRCATNCTW